MNTARIVGPDAGILPSGSMIPDDVVIDAVLHGDVERFAELVRRYQRAVFKLAYSWIGNRDDAMELTQNAFVNAYRYLASFRRGSTFGTWLYRIALNECKDFYKHAAARPRTISTDAASDADGAGYFELEDGRADPRRDGANRELARLLHREIDQLPGRQRTALCFGPASVRAQFAKS